VNLGPLLPQDLDAALDLSTTEGWNQTAADWRRLLALEPEGCFAARAGGRLAGTVTTTTYGRALAWIGMMIVHPDSRRQGVGVALMRAALDHLRERGVACVKLDATPAGRPLYEALGFAADAELERWHGLARGVAGTASEPRASIDVISGIDGREFGAQRTRVIESLVAEGVAEPLVVSSRDGAGFALARPGRLATYIGPLIATSAEIALGLLDRMLARLAGREVCLDLHRGGRLTPDALAQRGLALRRGLLRMRYGAPDAAGTGRSLCASAGPEFG
jgi:GNAT superfamily N-acetyltransferase